MGFSLLCLLRCADVDGLVRQTLYIDSFRNTQAYPTGGDDRRTDRKTNKCSYTIERLFCHKEIEALWYVKIKGYKSVECIAFLLFIMNHKTLYKPAQAAAG